MPSVNLAIIIGHVGQKPQKRAPQFATFSVATSPGKDIAPTWHNIAVFGKTADFVLQYLEKGDHVYIEGRINNRKWTTDSGESRQTTQIVANTVRILSRANKSNDIDQREATNKTEPPMAMPDSDIPF